MIKPCILKNNAKDTAIANDSIKVDSKNVVDYSYIVYLFEKVDLSSIGFSNKDLTDRFVDAMKEHRNITAFMQGGLHIIFPLNGFVISIDSVIDKLCVYNDAGHQMYKYHYASSARIVIYDSAKTFPIYDEIFNKPAYMRVFPSYTEIEYSKGKDSIHYLS